MNAHNYCAQAVKALLDHNAKDLSLLESGSPIPYNRKVNQDALEDTKAIHDVALQMARAQHFIAPDGGEILKDDLKGLIGLPLRLPYKSMTLEYYVPEEMQRHPTFFGDPSRRRVLFAKEVSATDADAMTTIGRVPSRPEDGDHYVALYGIFEHSTEGWQLCPWGALIPANWQQNPPDIVPDRVYVAADIFLPRPTILKRVSAEEIAKDFQQDMNEEVSVLLSFCEVITGSNVSIKVLTHADPKVNRKRETKGKVPIYETKVLVVSLPKTRYDTEDPDPNQPKRKSPSEHLRSGHWRHLEGKRVFIHETIIGSRANGHVGKRYAIIGARKGL